MAYTDGLDNILVTFDNEDKVFNAGDLLTGTVEVIVAETNAFRGIRLELKGTLIVKWIEADASAINVFDERQLLILEDLDVFTPDMKDRSKRWIFPGRHKFRFEYQLSPELPSSLENCKYANVDYIAKARVLLPAVAPAESEDIEFFINTKDKEEVVEAQKQKAALWPLENVEYGILKGGGMCSKENHVEIFLKTDRNVYKQGQVVRGHVECAVTKGKYKIHNICVILVQEYLFTCNPGEKNENRRKEVTVIGQAIKEESVQPGESLQYDMQIKIDKYLPITGFPYSDFVDCGYFLQAVAKTDRSLDDVVVKVPIIIQHGTPSDYEEEAEEIQPMVSMEQEDESLAVCLIDEYDKYVEVEDLEETEAMDQEEGEQPEEAEDGEPPAEDGEEAPEDDNEEEDEALEGEEGDKLDDDAPDAETEE